MAIRRVAVPLPTARPTAQGAPDASAAIAHEKTNAAAEATRRQLNNIPFAGGVWLQNVSVPTGVAGLQVAHNLRAVPRGYIITKSSAAPTVYSPQQSWTDRTLTFYNTGGILPQLIDVWIF